MRSSIAASEVLSSARVAPRSVIRVAAVSAITNLAEGMGGEELSHEQTLRNAEVAARDLMPLVARFCEELAGR